MLIGGLAAVTRGAPLVTQDVDVCYAVDTGNLMRLASALREVHAELRGADPGLPFVLEATPAGTSGYKDLAQSADVFHMFGQRVLVATIDDLIRMKRASGRTKDLLAVEELGALRDELDGLG